MTAIYNGPLKSTGVLFQDKTQGRPYYAFNITDDGNGSILVIEISNDAVTWAGAAGGYNLSTSPPTPLADNVLVKKGRYHFPIPSKYVRVRVYSYVGGDVELEAEGTIDPPVSISGSVLDPNVINAKFDLKADKTALDAKADKVDLTTKADKTALDIKSDTLPSVAAFAAARLSAPQQAAYISGYAAPGDGGGHYVRRISAPPETKPWHRQTADGAWWQISGNDIDVRVLGAVGGLWSVAISDLPDDYAALQAALDFVGLSGGRVNVPGRRRFRTNKGLVARPSFAGEPLLPGQNIHFLTQCHFDLVSTGGGAIVAGAAMDALLTVQYNSDLLNLGPFRTKIEGWMLDGNNLATDVIYSDYTMHLNVYRNTIDGGTRGGINFRGYGVARIWGNVFRGLECIRLQDGGGDSWIGANDFYPVANGCALSTAGGNMVFENCTISAEGLLGVDGVRVIAANPANEGRHLIIRGCEFSGTYRAVYATNTAGTRNMYALTIEDCHTTPAAGGAVHTGILAYIAHADEVFIKNNFCNSTHLFSASEIAILLFDCARVQVINNLIANYQSSAMYLNNVRDSKFLGNDIQDVGRAGTEIAIIDIDGGSQRNDFIDNTIRQGSAAFARLGFYERTGATANYGNNRVSGVATPSTVTSGSSSTFTTR